MVRNSTARQEQVGHATDETMDRKSLFAIVVLMAALPGCTTTRSMPLDRTPQDQLCADRSAAAKGIPITIRVPTHVDVIIHEKYFFQRIDQQLRQVRTQRPAMWVEVKPIETEKVITVDWKRPLAGSLAYSAKLGEDQYFDAIGSKVTDETIQQITAAVQAIAARPTSRGAVQGTDNLFEDDRVVAFQRFDLNECGVEEQILAFVHEHLNACHDCHGFVPEEVILAPAVSQLGEFRPGDAVDASELELRLAGELRGAVR